MTVVTQVLKQMIQLWKTNLIPVVAMAIAVTA